MALKRVLRKVVCKTSIDVKIWNFRRKGMSPDQISKALEVPLNRVTKSIAKAAARFEYEEVIERKLDVARLDEMLETYMPLALGATPRIVEYRGEETVVDTPDVNAAKMVIRIMERRSALLGLDTPKKVNAEVHTTHGVDEQIEKLMSKAAGVELPKSLPPTSASAIDVTSELVDEEDEEDIA